MSTTMHPDPIMRRLHACVLANVPAYMEGPPGGGKTSRVFALGRATNKHVQRWLLSRCEPIDIKPRVYHNGQVIVGEPPELLQLVEEARKVQGGIAFYDELNRATRETENASLDRIDAPPPGVAVIAAGNPCKRGQSARALGSAAANRFCHLDVPADPAMWANAQLTGWHEEAAAFPTPDPEKVARALTKAKAMTSTFIKRRPAMLDNEPDDPIAAGRGWASPRTWEYAQKVYAVAKVLGYGTDDLMALLRGCVGEAAAIEFMAFATDADLVDPEAWLAKPTSYDPDPSRIDRTIAALSAVVAAVQSNFDEKRWMAAWQILGHVGETAMDAAAVGGDMFITHYRQLNVSDASKVKGITPPHKAMQQHLPRLAALYAT